uniref:Uncharacterized protein n=1 Tax=Ditylenchus dipsaci TaxID=166011 RepID=A0A915DEE5_9BILA
MPFLVTYAFVNYAYVSLAMSHDLTSLSEEIGTSKPTYGSVQDFSAPENTLDNLFPDRNADASNRMFGDEKAWYSRCINRYISFAAAIVHVVIVVLSTNDQGLTRFSIVHMIQVAMQKENFNPKTTASDQLNAGIAVVPPSGLISGADYHTSRLNDDNNDYSARKPYHHSEHVGNID